MMMQVASFVINLEPTTLKFNSDQASPMTFGQSHPIVVELLNEANDIIEPERKKLKMDCSACTCILLTIAFLLIIPFVIWVCFQACKSIGVQESLIAKLSNTAINYNPRLNPLGVHVALNQKTVGHGKHRTTMFSYVFTFGQPVGQNVHQGHEQQSQGYNNINIPPAVELNVQNNHDNAYESKRV